MIKGFSQKGGINYYEIFSPVAKMILIRVLLSIIVVKDPYIKQLDAKIAFLHGDLDKELYIVQPKGFEVKYKEYMICRLKKSLYGLK